MGLIRCNRCGREMDCFDLLQHFEIKRPIIYYGSENDGYGLNIHICNKCMDKIIRACRISPLTKPKHSSLEEEYSNPAYHVERIWLNIE